MKPYSYWLLKNNYYHSFIKRFYQFIVPQNMRVLQIGCKLGYILDATNPRVGVGVDLDLDCINFARTKYPHLQFIHGSVNDVPHGMKFDYIILSSITMEVYDVQALFEALQLFCHPKTRIVIDSYSQLWEPILWLSQKLGLRRPTSLKNWLSPEDIKNFLNLADFEIVTSGRQLLFPFYIPLISWFLNSIVALIPLIDRLCLSQWFVARPIAHGDTKQYSVSVIIPCRNEKGNIQSAIERTPKMGASMEIIFVEGHSKDGTVDEIKRVIAAYPNENISWYVQTGKGKADAVRLGFDKAHHDIVMILDADLTVPPEELPKFYNALVSGKGDFINGSRLVYGMENGAMRILNLIANYLFGIGFSWVMSQRVKDTLCGTKVLFKKDYETIVANRAFFGEFDPFGDFDLLFGAAKQNFKIIDLPVHYKSRVYGETQIRRFYHGLILLKMSFIGFCKFKLRK